MAKLLVLFLTAVAAQAVLAGQGHNQQQQNKQLQQLSQHIQQVSRDATTGIQNFQAESSQGRRHLAHQANDFAFNLEKVVYYMQQAFNQHQQTFQGETQKDAKEIAQQLSEVAYNVQQAMNQDSTQLKNQLKEQVEQAAEQAQNVAQMAQQSQDGDFKQQMKQVLYYFLSATQKLRTQVHHQQQSHQEIYGQLQQTANQASNAVQNIKTTDEQTAEDLAAQTQQFAQKINHMIHKIQQWTNIHHQHHQTNQQAKMYMQQVANQLTEVHAQLQQAANGQGYAEQKVNEFKNQLTDGLRDVANHMQKMMQVAQMGSQDQQQDGHSASHVAKSVLVDFLAACQNMKTEMDIIARSQQ